MDCRVRAGSIGRSSIKAIAPAKPTLFGFAGAIVDFRLRRKLAAYRESMGRGPCHMMGGRPFSREGWFAEFPRLGILAGMIRSRFRPAVFALLLLIPASFLVADTKPSP